MRGTDSPALAQDSAPQPHTSFAQAVAEGMVFPGYPHLAELAQRAEYRPMVEVIATEATREWVTFRARGTARKQDRIAAL